MPRRPNTRPTLIYWLVDVRPETLAARGGVGFPFYCGKTVYSTGKRLADHCIQARRHPNRPVARWLKACEAYVIVHVVEVVPADQDWSARERRWIWVMRGAFPGTANVTAGGQGMPGYVWSPEQRQRSSRLQKGKRLTPEHVEAIRNARTGTSKVKGTWTKIAVGPDGMSKPEYAAMRAKLVIERQNKLSGDNSTHNFDV
jgi:hypothetical protein